MAKAHEIQVLLFQTGSTDWDDAGRLIGRSDVPMSDAGVEQVAGRVTGLGDVELSVVYAGPDEASLATAKALAEATGAKVKKLSGLEEMDLGLWEGMRRVELEDKFPTAYRQWREDPAGVKVPQGETLAEARQRVLKEMCRVLDKVKANSGAIGFVLRPMAYGLVLSVLDRTGTQELWSRSAQGQGFEWRSVKPAEIDWTRQEVRAGL